jgi:phage I-like protein
MKSEFLPMNITTTFEPAADGWFHIAPHGTFPHPNGTMQVLDAEACEAMQRTFDEEARQPNFPGLLVDFDHFSHDPAQPTTAAGWIGALEHRGDGLYAQIRWSDLGHQALTGGRYRLASPVWNRADCDQWTAAAGPDGRETVHLRPRRLDRLALTNDPNLPGLAPLSNRKEKGEREKEEGSDLAPVSPPSSFELLPFSLFNMNLRTQFLQELQLAGTATDAELVEALRRRSAELEALRNRCQRLQEAQADSDLERFADVITNRDVVRAQLVANREGTLALLNALRHPEPPAPLHQPRLHRPNLHLLSPVAAEPDPATARRVANRARQLQSQLKIGHHAAFRMAEGEAADPEVA